ISTSPGAPIVPPTLAAGTSGWATGGESLGSTSLLRSARSGEIAAQAASARIPQRQATRGDNIGCRLDPTRSTFHRSSRKWKRRPPSRAPLRDDRPSEQRGGFPAPRGRYGLLPGLR